MDKKIKSIFDEKWRQERLAKLSPKEREVVEKRIIESEKLAAKWRREEEALRKMPKEDRLKAICKEHLLTALDWGKMIQRGLDEKANREQAMAIERHSRRQMGTALTYDLKKFDVLPLGR